MRRTIFKGYIDSKLITAIAHDEFSELNDTETLLVDNFLSSLNLKDFKSYASNYSDNYNKNKKCYLTNKKGNCLLIALYKFD
jgi:hypothetical protein